MDSAALLFLRIRRCAILFSLTPLQDFSAIKNLLQRNVLQPIDVWRVNGVMRTLANLPLGTKVKDQNPSATFCIILVTMRKALKAISRGLF